MCAPLSYPVNLLGVEAPSFFSPWQPNITSIYSIHSIITIIIITTNISSIYSIHSITIIANANITRQRKRQAATDRDRQRQTGKTFSKHSLPCLFKQLYCSVRHMYNLTYNLQFRWL